MTDDAIQKGTKAREEEVQLVDQTKTMTRGTHYVGIVGPPGKRRGSKRSQFTKIFDLLPAIHILRFDSLRFATDRAERKHLNGFCRLSHDPFSSVCVSAGGACVRCVCVRLRACVSVRKRCVNARACECDVGAWPLCAPPPGSNTRAPLPPRACVRVREKESSKRVSRGSGVE